MKSIFLAYFYVRRFIFNQNCVTTGTITDYIIQTIVSRKFSSNDCSLYFYLIFGFINLRLIFIVLGFVSFQSIGGASPRTNVENTTGIFLAMNIAYFELASTTMNILLSQDNYPVPQATPAHKSRFIKDVLRLVSPDCYTKAMCQRGKIVIIIKRYSHSSSPWSCLS